MKAKALFCLKAAAIVLAGGWVYASVRHGGWLWDDDTYVTRNLFLRSAGGLAKIWLHPAGLLNYFPVTDTVQWLQWRLWGDRPAGYHLTNVALHLLSAFLLWRLMFRLGFAQGWLAGMIFALHPVAVESVAWVSEIKNTLSLPPLLMAMLAWIDANDVAERASVSSPSRSGMRKACAFRYLAALIWFLLAMLCKSTVAMFPFILLLYAWWRRGRISLADLGATLPFFAVSLVLGLVEIRFEHDGAMLGFDESPAHGPLARAAAAGLSLAFYFCKLVFPAKLLPTYPRWAAGVAPDRFLPWLLIAGFIWWLWTKRRGRGRHALFGLGCFGLNLALVAGFVPMAYQRISWVADHFAYLSLASLAGLGAAAFGEMASPSPKTAHARRSRATLWWMGAAVTLAALGWETRQYSPRFASREILWTYTLARNPDSWAAHNDWGNLLLQSGQTEPAVAEFNRAIRLEPGSVGAHNNLAAAWRRLGQPSAALAEYQACLRLGADYPEIHYNLGMALELVGRLPEAMAQYEQAVRQNPAMAEAWANLGAASANLGRLPEAIGYFRKAIALAPDDLKAQANLGLAFAQTGDLAQAIVQYREVLRRSPQYPDLHFDLAGALLQAGQLTEAVEEYRAALQARPEDRAAHYDLGLALRALGRAEEASREFERAGDVHPR